MSLLWQIGHVLKDVGRNIQYRFEGAVLDLNDFARALSGPPGGAIRDDVPDLLASMASFERMLRLLEEKRPWPDESLHLEGDEEFDVWRDWPISIRGGTMAATPVL